MSATARPISGDKRKASRRPPLRSPRVKRVAAHADRPMLEEEPASEPTKKDSPTENVSSAPCDSTVKFHDLLYEEEFFEALLFFEANYSDIDISRRLCDGSPCILRHVLYKHYMTNLSAAKGRALVLERLAVTMARLGRLTRDVCFVEDPAGDAVLSDAVCGTSLLLASTYRSLGCLGLADWSTRSSSGRSLLDTALRSGWTREIAKIADVNASYLVELSNDRVLNHVNDYDETPLVLACRRCYVKTLHAFVERALDLDAVPSTLELETVFYPDTEDDAKAEARSIVAAIRQRISDYRAAAVTFVPLTLDTLLIPAPLNSIICSYLRLK